MVWIDVMNLVNDIYLFSSLSFSVCYVFKSRIRNVHLLSVMYSFFFYSPRWRFVLQTEISGKYNLPLYFCSLSLFFYHSSRRKDQFTILNLKFGTQDFTDPGLLKIRWTLTGLSLWFCLHKCLWEKPLGIVSCHKYLGIFIQNDLQYGCNGIHKSERSTLKQRGQI